MSGIKWVTSLLYIQPKAKDLNLQTMVEGGVFYIMILKNQSALLNILLAEDDKDDRFFFEKVLKEISIETHLTTVLDGEQLMDYLLENVENLPDVIFLDLSMPRKNGFECLTEIKENAELKEIPVIMFSTSFARDKNYERNMINTLFKIGAQDYICKPNEFEILKKTIFTSIGKVIELKSHKDRMKDK